MADIIGAVSHQPNELISMGFHASLDTALQIALRQMIVMICEHTGITEAEAYQLCSLAADFAVTQSINQEKAFMAACARQV
ncbi:MAG: hypothetical protein HRU33_08595 [Rhodobacteraceae bacterium]|nr:hypothetical protein [Paracoccaceae bacterium]